MISKIKSLSETKKLISLVSIICVLKLLLLPFVQVTDSDAVTRIFNSEIWLDAPHWITTDVWGPFHYYINAFVIWVTSERVYAPVILNIILSCITLLPLFYFSKNIFGSKGAFISILIYGLSPIVVRNSFMAMSETPFIFFISITIYLTSNVLNTSSYIKKQYGLLILAGLSLTIASGIRYEGWIIIGLLTIVLWVQKKWLQGFVFGITSIIFPIAWLISNYLATGKALYFLTGQHEIIGFENNLTIPPPDLEDILRSIYFVPFSLLVAIGPLLFFFGFKSIQFKNLTFNQKVWLIPFLGVFLVQIVMTYTGNLLLHHRFIISVLLFFTPFISLYFQQAINKRNKVFIMSLIVMIGFSYIINSNQITPIPRIQNQELTKISNQFSTTIKKSDYLFVDQFDWESAYYLALHAPLHPSNMILCSNFKDKDYLLKDWEKFNSQVGTKYAVLYLDNAEFLEKGYHFKTLVKINRIIWVKVENL